MFLLNILKIILVIILFLIVVIGCILLYYTPFKESFLDLKIQDYLIRWTSSSGFEEVGNESGMNYSTEKKIYALGISSLTIWLKKPISPKIFNETNSRIELFYGGNLPSYPINDLKDPRTKIRINLLKWSNKPKGIIEGKIEATLYDRKGKPYNLTGSVSSYQAGGTIYNFH